MWDHISMSVEIGQLSSAFSAAQGQIKGAAKSSSNPFFKSKYADLASVWDSCREALTSQELSVSQWPVPGGLITMLSHSSGEWMACFTAMQAKDDSPQAIGSAITYARRYALAAVVGIPQVDDDAESAMGRSQPMDKKLKERVVATAMEALEEADELKLREAFEELNADEKAYIWREFSSAQRGTIKQMLAGGP